MAEHINAIAYPRQFIQSYCSARTRVQSAKALGQIARSPCRKRMSSLYGENGGVRVMFKAALAAAENAVPIFIMGQGTAAVPRTFRRKATCQQQMHSMRYI